ncbi:hypothetical protein BKA70DRAFT_1224149 [Coprinopsis sp. MPI-PUGE-AT-0042]|nr:hypothetical protein BKA70DRAFT_1224149 [Coprinopsis sp. MPI-PUGE-AT-0042]
MDIAFHTRATGFAKSISGKSFIPTVNSNEIDANEGKLHRRNLLQLPVLSETAARTAPTAISTVKWIRFSNRSPESQALRGAPWDAGIAEKGSRADLDDVELVLPLDQVDWTELKSRGQSSELNHGGLNRSTDLAGFGTSLLYLFASTAYHFMGCLGCIRSYFMLLDRREVVGPSNG